MVRSHEILRRIAARGMIGVCLVTLFSACASQMAGAPETGVASFDVSKLPPDQVDKLFVVDCLLPGQVRKLGEMTTYITPRRPVKTTAIDCEIRGGEYVAYDRADYATALKVWLPQAKAGSAEAQTYVGEIYEKGLGITPDYALAAQWYRKAADQGYARAQIDLGFLYEKGLGVAQNLSEAMNWYRKASGLSGGNLEFVSTVEASARAKQASELKSLRGEVAHLTKETESLQKRLDSAQDKLDKARSEKKSLETQLQDLQQRKQSLQNRPGASADERSQLDKELQQRQDQLARQNQAVNRLEREADQLSSKLNKVEDQREQASTGPTIEIVNPLLTATRGIPTVRLRSIERSADVMGRINAPAGIKFFKVNGQPERFAKDGSFKTRIPLDAEDNKVSMLVVDNNGRQAELDFLIQNAAGAVASAPLSPANDSLSKPGDLNFGNYYAVVIGNDDYTYLPKLRTAVHDARRVDQVLREQYGFKTTLLINADRRTILSALYELRQRLTPQDNLLIYYAGHGDMDRINDRGYWLPVDAEEDNPSNWISNEAITDIINTMPSKHIMVVVDSCYSGTLSRTAIPQVQVNLPEKLREQWLRLMTKSRSRTVLTSGGLEPVLDEGGEGDSVFAQAFVKALQNNHGLLLGYKLYREVAHVVTQRAARYGVNQVPEYAPIRHAGHETGQFFFVATS